MIKPSTTFIKRGLGLALLSFTSLVMAPSAIAVTKAQTQQITQSIEDALGTSGVKVLSITDVKYFDGLFEVVVSHAGGKKIIYSNGSGSHLILGDLIDSKTMDNLTEAKMDKLNAIAFNKDLPLKLALKSVYGKGTRKIAVFEDPNCGYCKRFRREALSKLDDATVYTFLYPVLGQDSIDKAQKVLCSADQTKVWDDWMLKGKTPSGAGDCNPPISQLVQLGRGLGVAGTPTIIFEDGTRASGAITASELTKRMSLAARN